MAKTKSGNDDDRELGNEFRRALKSADTDELRKLLDAGADPNHVFYGPGDKTVLHQAASLNGNPAAIRLLIERGADPTRSDSFGGLPIENAIMYGETECAQAFIDGGFDVNSRNGQQRTPLMVACEKRKDAIARLLLDAGADAAAIDSKGQSALSFAVKSGSEILVDLIKEAVKDLPPAEHPNASGTPEQINAMLEAAKTGDLETVQQLLSAGVHPDVCDQFGNIPLMKAAQQDHAESFFALLDAGANRHHVQMPSGQSVIRLTVLGGTESRLRMLQAILADGVTDDETLQGTFRLACGRANADIVREFLQRGVNVDGDGRYGPPILNAVEKNLPDVVAELIAAGARVDHIIPKDFDDRKFARKPLLALAVGKGFGEVTDLLRKAGAPEPEITAKKRPSKPQPVADSWKRIGKWLKQNAIGWKSLKRKATDKQIAAAESELGFKLPADLRESYATHNGADEKNFFPADEGCEFALYPLTEVVSNLKMLNGLLEIGDLPDDVAKPDKGVRAAWWHPQWIPFAGNGAGDHLCVDMAPDKGGKRGQIILVRNDGPQRPLLGSSFKAWLFEFANAIEDGRFEFIGDELQ